MGLENYSVIKGIGSGSFATVWQAMDKRTGEIVAMKMLKETFNSWEECLNLPEIKVLSQVMENANIVRLKEVIWQDKIVYLVFEYMDGNNLSDLMENRQKPFSEIEVKKWCFQVLQGLEFVHSHGFIHRDIKPDNLLLSKDNNVKIADFGLAIDIQSQSREDYLGTRFYRAPEILLRSKNYDCAVDMWAMGATMAELLGFHPLFPGSDEVDQMSKICRVIGSPKIGEWDEGFELARVLKYEFPWMAGVDLSMLIPAASEDAIDLIQLMCSWNPRKRPTANQALQHRFFQGPVYIPPSLRPNVDAAARFGYGASRDLPNFHEGDERNQNCYENEQIFLMRSVMQQQRSLLAGMAHSIDYG